MLSAFDAPMVVSMEHSDDKKVSTYTRSKMDGTFKSTIKVNQLDKGEDDGFVGGGIDATTNEYFDYMIVVDGHGGSACIQYLRSLRYVMDDIMALQEPEKELQRLITLNDIPLRSGSTFLCAKIFHNRIECRSVGDSEVFVFKNDELVAKNAVHNLTNFEECSRVKDVPTSRSWSYQVISPTHIMHYRGTYVHFEGGVQLSMTQSIGHRGVTGIIPDVKVIPLETGDKYRIVMFSDGFGNMFLESYQEDMDNLKTKTAEELVDIGETRWKKEWSYKRSPADETVVLSYEGYDDIVVGVVEGTVI